MFTPTPVNKIAAAYLGNPQPLAQKVEKDKQQNGGIPRDLRQLLALNDITQGRNAAGIQQALQTPTDMPTVAQSLQERARQAIQAQMMQQAQQQQRKEGLPMAVPPNAPRPPMQAQGIDNLPTNVGEGYAKGGIIGDVAHFYEGGRTSIAGDFFRNLIDSIGSGVQRTVDYGKAKSEKEEATPGLFEALTPKEREERLQKTKDLARKMSDIRETGGSSLESERQKNMKEAAQQGSPTDPNFRRVSPLADPRLVSALPQEDVVPPAPSPTDSQAATKTNKPAQPRVNADNAPMPGGLTDLAKLPSIGVGRDFLQRSLADNQKFDEEALKQKYLKEVGAKDTSIYDEMAAELKARKERLNAPKQGYEALMEYLGQIAQAGGRNWTQSGAIGASRVNALQKERQTQQDALMEKILDLGAKKKEAQYNERLGMFNLTKAEKDKINKESREIATALNLSEIEAEKMRQQAIENELNRKNQIRAASIGAQDRDNLMSRARALMAADPTKKMTLEQAMQRASEIASAGQMESAEVRKLKAFNDAVKDIDAKMKYMPMLLDKNNKPENAKLRAEYLAEINQARAMYGVTGQGINTLPVTDASGKVPPPSGYKRD